MKCPNNRFSGPASWVKIILSCVSQKKYANLKSTQCTAHLGSRVNQPRWHSHESVLRIIFTGEEDSSLSRWECLTGHIFEGNFFSPPAEQTGNPPRTLTAFACPACGEAMILSREEGAMELLKRIREFIGEVSKDPQYGTNGSLILTEVNRLEITIKKLAEEAARP
jgi:hypothetical protein